MIPFTIAIAILTLGHPKHVAASTPLNQTQIAYPTDFFEHTSQDIQSLGNAYSTDHFRPGQFTPNANLHSSVAK